MPRRVHSVVLCKCRRDDLCEACRTSLFAALKGTAACRGEAWADSVRLRVPGARTWPPHEGRNKDLALLKVGDLTSDPHLLEQLAAELAKWAAKRWNDQRQVLRQNAGD